MDKTKSVIAKSDDGTIQITFTIPFSEIQTAREATLKNISETAEIPGFRKGKAPVDKVKESINDNTLLERTLSGILPNIFAKSIEEHKLKPIIYPKFELIKAKDGEDWQVRAVTCEAPDIELGDYKKKLAGSLKASTIWTPDKAKTEETKKNEQTLAEKEQEVLKTLLKEVPVKIPKVLLDEDVNARLSSLLARLEKLGLQLESYLSSVGKTADTLRKEYETQSKESLSIDFVLNKIAEVEQVEVKTSEIDAAILAATQSESSKEESNPEQRRFIEAILKRRKALDSLMTL